jgi:HK97 family phage major capsid protein
MKLSLKEFEAQLALAKTLAGDARTQMIATLKAATVYETDDKGAENILTVKVLDTEPTPAPVAKEANVAELVKAEVATELAKAKPEAKSPITPVITVPAEAKRYKAKNFKSDEDAYVSGMWFLATLGSKKAMDFCNTHGVKVEKSLEKVHNTTSNTAGGFLVIPQFDNAIIDLQEKYGVFRQFADVRPMGSDTLSIPRRTGGLVTYFPAEGDAGTESDKSWDHVNLTAKKAVVLTRISSELNEDAIINVADDLAREIAISFAQKEDDCGFNGDGTAPYARIVGARSALTNLSGTIANIAGLQVSTGTGYATNWNSVTLADFNNLLGRLPQYAYMGGDAAFYCSQAFWGSVLQRLALAAGGTTSVEVVNGVPTPTFLGYPVRVSQVLPTTSAINQVACLFGSLRLAAKFGDRRGTTISVSDSASVNGQSVFERDQLAIRGTKRFDIVVHDVGNASATAASRVAGPIVGLITAGS